MVKVTIEKDGKEMVCEGEFYVGAVASFSKGGPAIHSALVGEGDLDKVAQVIGRFVPEIICRAADDPIVAAGTLVEIHDSIDEYIKKYLNEHADDIAAGIKKL